MEKDEIEDVIDWVKDCIEQITLNLEIVSLKFKNLNETISSFDKRIEKLENENSWD